MNMNTVIRNLNREAKRRNEPYRMPHTQESWSDRHSTVKEMWSNPDFSHGEAFKAWACWWFSYLSHDRNLYEEMKGFSLTEKAVLRPKSRKLWKVMDGFFALYYIEFPFPCCSPPTFDFNSVEEFFDFLSE